MSEVFGKMNLNVSVEVESESEEMGLLEANYRFNPNLIVGYELVAIDCRGSRHKVNVHDCDSVSLNEYIG